MGKPLKAKQLNISTLQRDRVLKWQNVKVNKRIRIGHSGHFGKVEVVPLERGSGDGKQSERERADSTPQLKDRLPNESHSKFMKRIAKETQDALVDLSSKTRIVKEKKKSFLAGRKEISKDRKLAHERNQLLSKIIPDLSELEDQSCDSEKISEVIKNRIANISQPAFGHQAERPPQIKLSKPLKGLKKKSALSDDGGCIDENERIRKQSEMLRKNAIQAYRDMNKHKRPNFLH
mmetsp:Transcript_59695/g.158892  ORF Transcript_59695/g.158892 Transcript_59695/m.158892 type:complete len:234 (+) Transcript_59695:49-750(+)